MGKVVGLTFESTATKRPTDSKKSDTNSTARTPRNNMSQAVATPENESNGGDA